MEHTILRPPSRRKILSLLESARRAQPMTEVIAVGEEYMRLISWTFVASQPGRRLSRRDDRAPEQSRRDRAHHPQPVPQRETRVLPDVPARAKVAGSLLAFFQNDATTEPWYVSQSIRCGCDAHAALEYGWRRCPRTRGSLLGARHGRRPPGVTTGGAHAAVTRAGFRDALLTTPRAPARARSALPKG